MKVSDIRKQFKELGYRISVTANPLNENIVAINFPDFPEISNCNVFPAATYEKHRKALALRNTFDRVVLEDGRKIIV